MGQYYRPTIINKDGIETFYAHNYQNGLKLMEHSWVGNFLVQAVVTRLLNNPSMVFWWGDYVETSDISKEIAGRALFDYRVSIDNKFVKDVNNNVYDKDIISETNFSHPNYIINHTKKVYLDLDDCTTSHGFASDEDDWVVHPLPLLTAVGNGRGCGDYFSDTDKQYVGTWAGDVIETSYEVPGGYEKVNYYFRED